MATPTSVTYVDYTTPAITAAWLNGVNDWVNGWYGVMGATYTAGAFRTALAVVPTGLATASGLTQSTGKLLGRTTAATGAIEEITVGSGLSLSAGTLTASAIPAGTILDFAGAAAQIPSGYIVCDGAAVSRTVTYNTLFAAIGTLWGVGNGTTTFNVPNFPAFYAAVQNNGTVGASTTGEIKAHVHAISYVANLNGSGSAQGAGSANNATFGTATQSTGGTANLAAGMCVLKIIKY